MTHRESFLDGDLARPLVVVRLALDKNQLGVAVSVPPQPEGNGPGRLVESSVVQLELVVVQIYRVGKLRVGLARRRLLQKDGQMPQNVVLDPGDVLRLDPVFCGLPQKGLLVLVFVGDVIVSQAGVNVGEPDHQIGIVPSDPGLGVHPRDVKCLAGHIGKILVVLFEDLVKSHEINVDVFFQPQKIVGDFVGLVHVDGLLLIGIGLEGFDLGPQFRDLLEGKLFDLCQLDVHLAQEFFLRDGLVAHGQTSGVRLGRDRHGDLSVLQIGAFDKTTKVSQRKESKET